ncbi:methionine ABC transporter ATP-binding protein [Anoxynatronum sibiricum]|uniref:methionine ABC transporter ATP-binding protein n=1 Tax=Anoxynatronum sibiricum TaxID=210623 RepID=UPI0031B838E4
MLIQLHQVSKTFQSSSQQVEALREVSLQVNPGEIYGIIGHSGAGKSTLIRIVNLLEKPTSGHIDINGVDLTKLSPQKLREIRRSVGMIFQGFNLLKTATVEENIALPLRLTGLSHQEISQRVEKYLAVVGLTDKKQAYPSQLSGGQKQRVAIARALSHEPKILLSDEATSALDPETTESILDLLLSINREFGITILLITHEMNVIQRICDRVAVMEDGRIVEEGTLLEVYSDSRHPTTKKFINSQFPQSALSLLPVDEQDGQPVLELSFVGAVTDQPVLAEVSKRFQVSPNILSGNIVPLKNAHYGKLIVQLLGDREETAQAVAYIISTGVKVEELKGGEAHAGLL